MDYWAGRGAEMDGSGMEETDVGESVYLWKLAWSDGSVLTRMCDDADPKAWRGRGGLRRTAGGY